MKKELYEHIEPSFMIYAMTTIMDRALPDVRDGMKPIHRKILYSMKNKGITSDKERAKSSEPVSETMKIHGHGDTSIYGALALMTQRNESLLHPYIDGEGAFGKAYNRDSPSAMRYTFCKLNKFSEDTMFNALNKKVVDFVEEGEHIQPVVLPVTYPNILIKNNSGIAVGMSCNFPSFNLNEVCDATISYLSNTDIPNLIPDFSTGGDVISDEQQIKLMNTTGRGSIIIRSKWRYDEDNNCIEVYEIPYSTTVDEIIDKVSKLIKSGKLKEVLDIRDETGFDTKSKIEKLKLTIDIKKKTDPNQIMAILYKMTPLQSSFSANMNCLCDNKPQVLGVHQIIQEWAKFRKQCLKRELEYDMSSLKVERNKLRGLDKITEELDVAIALIRQSKSEEDAISKLISHFSLNEEQATYVSSIRLINMNEEWVNKKLERLQQVEDTINVLSDNLDNDNYYNQTIIDQLTDIKKKYGQNRRTQIIHEHEVETVSTVDMVESYTCQIVLTKDNYLKKTLKYSDVQKVKDGDEVIQQFQSNNKHKLLLFTDKANVYYLNAWEVNQCLPSTMGTYLPSLLSLQDEKIIYATSTDDFKGYMLFAFESGRVAKVTLDSYATKTNRTKVINAYNTDSPLVSIHKIDKDCDFVAVSSIDKVLVVDSSQINAKSTKSTQGVNVLRSKNDSTMIEFKLLTDADEEVKSYYRANIPATGKYNKKDLIN